MPYVVYGRWTVKAGHEHEVLALMSELGRHSRRESGSLLWQAHQAPDAPHELLFYEQYEDKAAFDVHWAAEYTQRLLPQALEHVESRQRGQFVTVDIDRD
jgi:quinol monooxygenase YgiN